MVTGVEEVAEAREVDTINRFSFNHTPKIVLVCIHFNL